MNQRTAMLLWSFAGLTLVFGPAMAQRSSIGAKDQLPDIECSQTRCSLIHDATPALATRPTEAFTQPDVVAPPSGQRYLWKGANYPTCQSFIGMIPQPTLSDPYEYVYAQEVPVPLGSTHASLLASLQVNLRRGADGNAAIVGLLQIRRSGSGAWANVSNSYAYNIVGQTPSQNLYNHATFDGLVDLASLPSGTGVPSMVDVRMAAFPLYTSGSGVVERSAVCWGTLQVAF